MSEILSYFSGIISLSIVLIYPSFKTLESLQRQSNRALWAQYWIGISAILFFVSLIRWILIYISIYPFAEVIISLILVLNNGSIVRSITYNFIQPILNENSSIITKWISKISKAIAIFSNFFDLFL